MKTLHEGWQALAIIELRLPSRQAIRGDPIMVLASILERDLRDVHNDCCGLAKLMWKDIIASLPRYLCRPGDRSGSLKSVIFETSTAKLATSKRTMNRLLYSPT